MTVNNNWNSRHTPCHHLATSSDVQQWWQQPYSDQIQWSFGTRTHIKWEVWKCKTDDTKLWNRMQELMLIPAEAVHCQIKLIGWVAALLTEWLLSFWSWNFACSAVRADAHWLYYFSLQLLSWMDMDGFFPGGLSPASKCVTITA